MIVIERIINRPVTSNCYVIYNESTTSCIVIDPGTEDCKELLEFLKENDLHPEYIILTHEHIDHIIGIKEILNHFEAKLLCSSDCNEYINSLKYNLSGYSEQFEERSDLPLATLLLEDLDYTLKWGVYTFKFYKAEGHSRGSIFFNVGENLFIGDTLIKGQKTTTVLPGSSKEKLIATLNNILAIYNPEITKVFSGHFEYFYLCEIENQILENIEYLKHHLRKTDIQKPNIII